MFLISVLIYCINLSTLYLALLYLSIFFGNIIVKDKMEK